MTTATSKSNHKICWQQAIYTYAHSHTHTHGQSNMQCIISVLSYATPMRPLRLIKFKSECFLVTQIAKQTNSPKRNKKMPDSLPPLLPVDQSTPSSFLSPMANSENHTVPASAIFTHAHAKVYSEKMTSAAIVSIEFSQSGVFSYSQPTLPSPCPYPSWPHLSPCPPTLFSELAKKNCKHFNPYKDTQKIRVSAPKKYNCF